MELSAADEHTSARMRSFGAQRSSHRHRRVGRKSLSQQHRNVRLQHRPMDHRWGDAITFIMLLAAGLLQCNKLFYVFPCVNFDPCLYVHFLRDFDSDLNIYSLNSIWSRSPYDDASGQPAHRQDRLRGSGDGGSRWRRQGLRILVVDIGGRHADFHLQGVVLVSGGAALIRHLPLRHRRIRRKEFPQEHGSVGGWQRRSGMADLHQL